MKRKYTSSYYRRGVLLPDWYIYTIRILLWHFAGIDEIGNLVHAVGAVADRTLHDHVVFAAVIATNPVGGHEEHVASFTLR